MTDDITTSNNQARLKALLNALPDLLFVLNREGVYTEVHATNLKELIVPPDKLVGSNIRELGLSDDIVEHNLRGIEAILTQGYERYDFDYRFNIEKAPRYYNAQMVRLNDNEVLTLVRDVTALHHVQDMLGNHINDLMVLRQLDEELTDKLDAQYISELALDASFRITNASSGFVARRNAEGRLQPTFWLGDYEETFLKTVLEMPNSLWQTAINTLKPAYWTDISPERAIGLQVGNSCAMAFPLVSGERLSGIICLEGKGKARFDSESFGFLRLVVGRVASSLENARLYEKTQIQLEELRLAHEQVTRLEQIKTDMIRIASHDLRNPLAGIMGYLEMFRWEDQNLTSDQKNYLTQIERATRRMQNITTGILSLERIEQLANQQYDQRLDLAPLIEQIALDQDDFAQRKNIRLSHEITTKPVPIHGDSYQIHEAVTNLVQNAIKYTPEGGRVQIRLLTEAHYAILEVIDTGYGIPESQQERIFSAFFRAKMNETNHIEGTGLGLHLVKNIIERHNGFIAFESKRGKGSTFTFRLPLAL